MASDSDITVFSSLTKCLGILGKLSDKRLVMLVNFFFYKNSRFAIVFSLFCAQHSCSTQLCYQSVHISLSSTLFTAAPIFLCSVDDVASIHIIFIVRQESYYRQQTPQLCNTLRFLSQNGDGIPSLFEHCTHTILSFSAVGDSHCCLSSCSPHVPFLSLDVHCDVCAFTVSFLRGRWCYMCL